MQEPALTFAPLLGFGLVLLMGLAALFMMGRGALGKVSLRPLASFQLLLVLFAAAPASILAAQVSNMFSYLALPEWLRPPVQPPATLSNPWWAIAALCLIPAVAQELVFRGIVGRALTARCGALIGMTLTTVAFAASYVYPERIAEMLVLGVVLYFVFATTRSLAASILFYALCAAGAMLIARHPDALSIPGYTHPQVSPFISTPLLAASGLALAAVLASLYLTRTRDLTADGKAWTPGYFSLERPPPQAQAKTIRPDAHGGLVMLVLAVFAGFVVTMFWENQLGLAAVEAYKRDQEARLRHPWMFETPPGEPAPAGVPKGLDMGPAGKGKGAKGKFGKGRPDMGPLTEGDPGRPTRPARPAFDDANEPARESQSPPESLEANALPPARAPTL
jgi:membrane protease YdiL (CAAX protease family)